MNNKNPYARFYAVFNRIPYSGDRAELKEYLVLNATTGRTASLRQMKPAEYERLCIQLETLHPIVGTDVLRRKRSVCLRIMQQLGIDTTSWDRINAFCQDARIAGQPFRNLAVPELDALARKLRAMLRKGPLTSHHDQDEPKNLAPVINLNN